jgi:hypothetical protein
MLIFVKSIHIAPSTQGWPPARNPPANWMLKVLFLIPQKKVCKSSPIFQVISPVKKYKIKKTFETKQKEMENYL